jgi:potassium-transporting ATPase KdpC subunit
MLTAIRFTILILILGGLIYPLAMTGIGQLLFPHQANGSLIKRADGQVIGSSLIGQNFTQPEYFHPRPAVNNYDASNSGGSNLGATSKKLIDRIEQDVVAYRKNNPREQAVPIDAVTTSASNLDPHISLANAFRQISRVAQARKMTVDSIKALVLQMSEKHLLAEAPYINVLKLNLALDQLQAKGDSHGS